MVRTLFKSSNSNRLLGMAELQGLVSTMSGPDARSSLDARALADIERAILDGGRPELIALYRRVLTDDVEEEKSADAADAFPFTRPWSAIERATAFVTNCLTFLDRITGARRRGRRSGYQPTQ